MHFLVVVSPGSVTSSLVYCRHPAQSPLFQSRGPTWSRQLAWTLPSSASGGGAGERVVQELLEAEPSLRAVVVDQNEDAGLSAADVSVEFVGVWHGGLDIRTLIQQGEYGDAATA